MNIGLTTIGSTGDMQPFLALGCALKRAGHRVRVCSHGVFAKRFSDAGLTYFPVGPDFDDGDRVRIWKEIEAAGDNMMSQFRVLSEALFFRGARERFEGSLRALAGCDLVVCHHGDLMGQEAALRLRLPWIGVYLCPGFTKHP